MKTLDALKQALQDRLELYGNENITICDLLEFIEQVELSKQEAKKADREARKLAREWEI